MALIECNECGKEISDKAPHCVHCGAPVEQVQMVETFEAHNITQDSAHDDWLEGIITDINDDKSDLPWKYKIRSIEGISYLADSDVKIISDSSEREVAPKTIILFDGDLKNGRVRTIDISDNLPYLTPENFTADTGLIRTNNPAPSEASSPKPPEETKVTRNFVTIAILLVLIVAYWLSKGTPAPDLIFASDIAKKECVRLANENKGTMMILSEPEVIANDSWIKNGKRVVQLTQTDEGKIRTIMCLYGNGMVTIPSLYEQALWR